MQNYTDNTNGDVPLTSEDLYICSFFWDKVAYMLFWKEKQILFDQSFSLWKSIFIDLNVKITFYGNNVNHELIN